MLQTAIYTDFQAAAASNALLATLRASLQVGRKVSFAGARAWGLSWLAHDDSQGLNERLMRDIGVYGPCGR